jgi:alpha-N-arabinofuranosidase
MRDAVLAASTLNTFNRHADKIAMANVAQLINCLQSLFLASEEKFVLTPTFHVFEMFAAHQGGQSIRTVCSAPRPGYTRNGQPATIRGLSESASLTDRQVVLSITNSDATQPRLAEIAVRGAVVKSARATVLAAKDIHAHNSFELPRGVEPADIQVASTHGSTIVHEIAPASVARLLITIE